MLIGFVGQEPSIHYYDADQCVATFSLATTERGYELPNGTKVPDRTEWHRIVLFKGLAKYAERYIHKGDKLFVEGTIRYRNEDDKKGIKRTIVEIYGENLEWLSAPKKAKVTEDTQSSTQNQSNDSTNLPF